MAETIENRPVRRFSFLRKRKPPLSIEADTLCDAMGSGVDFILKRNGEPVGRIAGEVLAWWVEQSGVSGKSYCLELESGASFCVVADGWSEKTEPIRHDVFTLQGVVVATVYEPQYSAWHVEQKESLPVATAPPMIVTADDDDY